MTISEKTGYFHIVIIFFLNAVMSPGWIPTYPGRIMNKIKNVFHGGVLRMNWGKQLLLVSQVLRYGLFHHRHITVINLTNPKVDTVPHRANKCAYTSFFHPLLKPNACACPINIFTQETVSAHTSFVHRGHHINKPCKFFVASLSVRSILVLSSW